MAQARVGGQIGINGVFYEGGQFLPNSPETIKGAAKLVTKKASKKEIAPYKWVVSTKQPLWVLAQTYATFIQTSYSKENGAEGFLTVIDTLENNTYFSPIHKANILKNIQDWNNGIRFREDQAANQVFKLVKEGSQAVFSVIGSNVVVNLIVQGERVLNDVLFSDIDARLEWKKLVNEGFTIVK